MQETLSWSQNQWTHVQDIGQQRRLVSEICERGRSTLEIVDLLPLLLAAVLQPLTAILRLAATLVPLMLPRSPTYITLMAATLLPLALLQPPLVILSTMAPTRAAAM